MKIVVVFPRQRPRGSPNPIEFTRQAYRFRFCCWVSYAGFQPHATNLIRKCLSASIAKGSIRLTEPS
jgi:hypothetical protein